MVIIKNRLARVFTFFLVLFLGMISPLWCAQTDYDGYYAGTFSGDDNGIWIALLDSSSQSVFLSYSTDSEDGDLGFLTWGGETGVAGNYFTNSTEILSSSLDADIDSSDGSVSGSWSNPGSGASGGIAGNKVTSVTFAGTYSGSISGDTSGTWTLTIASNGSITGSYTTNDGSGDVLGVCHPDGYVLAVGDDDISGTDVAMFGKMSGVDISGSWEAEDGSSGTFSTGASVGVAGASSSGGGGGGCFISTITQ